MTTDREQLREQYRAEMIKRQVPEHLHDGLCRYLVDAIEPGDFLMAVLTNDLKKAFLAADEDSTLGIRDLMRFLLFDVPSGAWGTPERVGYWLMTGK